MGWWRRRPLSTQLVVLVVVLGGLALLAAGVVAAASLRSYLEGQVDQQLMAVSGNPTRVGSDDGGPPEPWHLEPHGDDRRGMPPGEFYAAVVAADGQASVVSRPFRSGSPDLSAALAAPTGQPVTVAGTGGAWRVVVTPTGTGSTVVGKPLAEIDQTVTRLAAVEAAIGLAVLGLLALGALFAVRRSLRPLTEVEHTATAIAGGDLTRRVPEHEPGTEVGQLSAAVNTMLDEITGTIGQRDVALAEAQASEARMRQFVADASHELRTPLTTIRGYSELYRQGGIGADQVATTFGRVEGEATRMGTLVDDLLLLARLDQQRPLERRDVDVLQVATEVVAAAGASHPERSVRMRSYGSLVPIVVGDEARLRQVVTNLVGNALKYSGDDVTVSVDTRQPDWVLVSVADHGPGIPDGDKTRVFERFFRGDASRTRSAGGTGLGLSIVAAIVGAHHGTTGVRDNAGGGAIVDVWLPARA